MNDEIQNEMILMMGIYNIDGTEQVKILAIISKILANEEYTDKIKEQLNSLINDDFNIINEFSRLISLIIQINRAIDTWKDITEERVKFIIYAIIFNYLFKNQPQILNNIPRGDIRLVYSNCIDLVMIIPQTLKIGKEGCCNFLGRKISWLSCIRGDRIKI